MARNFIMAVCCCLAAFTAGAQQSAKIDSIPQERVQSVYFELLGPGGLYSVNYDTRLNNRPDGIGLRGGISYTKVTDASLFTLPVQFNYLLGKNDKYFEMGLGATYATASVDFFDEKEETVSGSTVFGTMIFGYRKQPSDDGFMFRAGVSPIFQKDAFIPYYFYLSFGYAFR